MKQQPYVVPSTARRDFWIGLAIVLTILALAVLGLKQMAGGISGVALDGTVIAMHFTPFEEKQVTFGKGGVHQIDGEYVLECDVKGRVYLVTVSKETYNAKKVGDHFLFARPRE